MKKAGLVLSLCALMIFVISSVSVKGVLAHMGDNIDRENRFISFLIRKENNYLIK